MDTVYGMEPVVGLDAPEAATYERTEDDEEEVGDLNLKARVQRLGKFLGRLKWLKRKARGMGMIRTECTTR